MQAAPSQLGDPAVLDGFHPLVAGWFGERFGVPTAAQAGGWPRIAAGDDVLIAAPTGSGKTLAAFLACIDALVRQGLSAPLPDGVQILYVSPLKALSNDVQRNLEAPLAELAAVAARDGVKLPEIRVAVRTGDTPVAERARQAKHPPHILVTTPESLYILLTTDRGRAALASVRTVIVDEIHAVAPSKRGAHLALSLERLERLVTQAGRRAPVRVGLSATQRPIELVGRLLVGTDRPLPHIVDAGHRRAPSTLPSRSPTTSSARWRRFEQLERVYDHIAEQVRAHRSTLVFVNTRRMVERVAAALEDRLGEDAVVAHHGSMARERRLAAEQRLKHGEVRCAVATASSSSASTSAPSTWWCSSARRARSPPCSSASAARATTSAAPPRAGSTRSPDQLVECAALVRGVRTGNLDTLEAATRRSTLAQQLVAICAAEGEAGLGEAELLALARRAASYAELGAERFEQLLAMLDEGASSAAVASAPTSTAIAWPGSCARSAGPAGGDHLRRRHPRQRQLHGRAAPRGDPRRRGRRGLRHRQLRRRHLPARQHRVADPSHRERPGAGGGCPGRTAHHPVLDRRGAGAHRGAVRRGLRAAHRHRRPPRGRRVAGGDRGVAGRGHLDAAARRRPDRGLPGGRPGRARLRAEQAGAGRRALLRRGRRHAAGHPRRSAAASTGPGPGPAQALLQNFDFELQAAATDDGIVISLGQPHSFALDTVFGFLPSSQAESTLVQALLDAPMFEVRWRWNATRSLAVLRRMGGKKVAPHLVRMRAADLLSVVFPQAQACQENIVGPREVPDHPLVFETVRDCLVEVMDVAGLTELMGKLERGELAVVARDTVEPSVLSHELLNANPYAFLDDAPLEERRTRALTLRRGLGAEVAAVAEVSTALDDAAIAAAEEEVTPEVRSVDELHDALLALWLVPATRGRALAPDAARWMAMLEATGRATTLTLADGTALWCAIDRLGAARLALDAGRAAYLVNPALEVPPWAPAPEEPETAVRRIVAGQLDHRGPITAPALAAELGLRPSDVVAALLALEGDGAILRGQFAGGPATPTTAPAALAAETDGEVLATVQWCNRRILARIHRLTLVRLRREIEPVSPAALMRFLVRWQRVGRNAQLLGADGLGRVVEQLQGWQTAAGAWEREVLPARLHAYEPAWLDQLCLGGELTWCRLTPRVQADDEDAARPRSTPSRAAPLAILRRIDAGWVRSAAACAAAEQAPSTEAAAVADALARRGASFFSDLVADTGLDADVVSDALWELVAAGRATADGFASLRVLVDRRRGESRSLFDAQRRTDAAPPAPPRRWLDAVKRARDRDSARPRHAVRALPAAGGRWSLLTPPVAPAGDVAEAWARQLLARYGVVFRDLLAREVALPPWRDLVVALRRLEARGEIRGGRFVSSFVGEQFALPEAVEGLRAARAAPATPEAVTIAATDPLNLVGVLSPGPRVPAVLGNAVLLVDGVVVASREAGAVVRRGGLAPGARVDDDLTYHPPPRAVPPPPRQVGLPLAL
ncbi:MAG: DEAD/DEAH box helicase [Kofleriaceae bacterium]